MIEFFRKNRRGVVGFCLVGMCASLMLPFGMDYFQKQSGNEVIATVGKKEIQSQEYYTEVERVRSMLKRQFGAQYEQFEKMINVKQKVLDEMIDKSLLEVFFKSLNFVVSINQVEAFTRGLPAFSEGIDRSRFQAFLRAQGMTEAAYEESVREKLMEDQLNSLLGSLALYGKSEREARFQKKGAKIGAFYSKISHPIDDVKIESGNIQEYYSAHKADYKTEKQVQTLVVRFSPERYKSTVKADEQELIDLYKSNQDRYKMTRKVRYETLSYPTSKSAMAELIEGEKANEDADNKVKALVEDLRAELSANPDKFQEIGKAKGATLKKEKDLVAIDTLKSEVGNVVDGLKLNEISTAFKLGEEYLVLRVVEEIPASIKSFEEVKEELKSQVVNTLAPEYAKVAGENFLRNVEDQGYQGREDTIRKLSTEKGLVLEESNQAVSVVSDVALESMPEILSLTKGSSTLVGDKAKTGYVFVYAKDVFEPKEKELNQVSREIELELKRKEAQKISEEKANSILLALNEDAKSGTSKNEVLKKLLEKQKLKIEEIAPEKRDGLMLPFVEDPRQKAEIISALESRGFYSEPYTSLTGETYIIGLSKIEHPKNGSSAEEMQTFMAAEQKAVSASALNQILAYMKSEVKPEVSAKAGL